MKSDAGPIWIDVSDAAGAGGSRIRIIELRRPEKLNCLSLAMLEELQSALDGCAADLLVLTGAGRSFCTGLDLREITGPAAGQAHLERLVKIYDWLLGARIPTVVLARGHAAGGGVGLAACARLVIAGADFRARIPAGPLTSLASVVVPICNLRAGDRTPPATGWLGCDLDAAAACRLGLADQVVPEHHLEHLMRNARSGTTPREWRQGPRPNEKALARTRRELREFLQSFRNNHSPGGNPQDTPRRQARGEIKMGGMSNVNLHSAARRR